MHTTRQLNLIKTAAGNIGIPLSNRYSLFISTSDILSVKDENDVVYELVDILNPASNLDTVSTILTATTLSPSFDILKVVGITGDTECVEVAQGVEGQKLKIVGTSNTDTYTLKSTTTNVKLNGGVDFTLGLGDNMSFICLDLGAGLTWYETSRCNLS